jgi:hypothetical protein
MSKLIKLVNSPFNSPIEEACGLIFQIHVPYNKDSVTLLVNPNIVDYKESAGEENIKIQQLTVSLHNKQILLDFKFNNIQTIQNEDKIIEVKLMKIDTENIQGQDFLLYEIFVSEV